jgi:hypothetical protein
MRVKVCLERKRGEFQPSYGSRRATAGDLHLTYRTTENRRVAVLQLLGADCVFPNLYDPKLTDMSGNVMRFIGYEPADHAWHMQEWVCELC